MNLSMRPAWEAQLRTSRQIKVAHVTTISYSLKMLLLNQMASLQASGYDVIGVSSDGPEVEALRAKGIRHAAVSMKRSISPLEDFLSLVRLCQLFQREQCAIVHTHTPKAGLLGQLAARVARVPIVVNTLHGFYFHENMSVRQRQFYVALEKLAARCSDVILSQNQEDIETAIRLGICSKEQITYLGNGIDLQMFSQDQVTHEVLQTKRMDLRLSEETLVVGFVGRLAAKRKGFLDFMAAAQRLVQQHPTMRFLIVGKPDKGKEDAVDLSIAADYGIADHCLFLGERPNHELPFLYALMHVLVLPSLFEGMPRAIMEAAAMGVPAVATHVKGNREVVEHEKTGLLVPLGDVPALADAIAQVLAHPVQRKVMQEQARKRAREHFDEQIVFEKVKYQYSELLLKKGFRSSDSAYAGPFRQ